MTAIQMAIFGFAFVAWACALFSWFAAIANRAEQVSLLSLLFNSLAILKAENFTEQGLKHRRRYFWSLAVFFVSGFVWIAAGTLRP